MYQDLAWHITLTLVGLLALVFIIIASRGRSETDYAPIQKGASTLRTLGFWVLLIVLTPIIIYSLADLPYSANAGVTEGEVIRVTGRQWFWEIDKTQITAGTPVAFHVTSADVNHGFAIYNPELQVVAQTQAMPDYTNVLHYTFTEPGTYRVLCLEYCGLAHHNMTAVLTVVAP